MRLIVLKFLDSFSTAGTNQSIFSIVCPPDETAVLQGLNTRNLVELLIALPWARLGMQFAVVNEKNDIRKKMNCIPQLGIPVGGRIFESPNVSHQGGSQYLRLLVCIQHPLDARRRGKKRAEAF